MCWNPRFFSDGDNYDHPSFHYSTNAVNAYSLVTVVTPMDYIRASDTQPLPQDTNLRTGTVIYLVSHALPSELWGYPTGQASRYGYVPGQYLTGSTTISNPCIMESVDGLNRVKHVCRNISKVKIIGSAVVDYCKCKVQGNKLVASLFYTDITETIVEVNSILVF